MNKEYIGFIASFLNVLSLVPQVVKIYRTQSTSDLSFLRYTMVFMATLLWSIYFWNDDWLAFTNETLCALLYSYVVYMKITEKKRRTMLTNHS